MAGFEVVVRPVVFPNIRPTPNQSALPPDDPTKGLCVIEGSSGQWVEFADSWSISMSHSKPIETERRVDIARVYQMDDNGNVNRNNFIDVEVPNRITAKGGKGLTNAPVAGVEVASPYGVTEEDITTYYQRQQEDPHIDLLQRDVIRKPDTNF
jgi:hypothetical protein